MSYPQRPKVFPIRVIQALRQQNAARDIGAVGCWLVSLIAETEDRFGCCRAVNFPNSTLCELMGSISENTLAKVRAACVKAGWLHYEKGNRSQAPIYWVTIPNEQPKPVETEAKPTKPEPTKQPTPEPQKPTPADRLHKLGVTLAVETINNARRGGMTDAQLDQVIDYAERNRSKFGPGAIVQRLTIADAARLPADQGWPNPRPPDPEIAAAKVIAQTAQQLKADRDHEQRHSERRERLRQLELQFGPDLDELTIGQIVQLLPKESLLREFVLSPRFGPRSPLVRDKLLETIATMKG